MKKLTFKEFSLQEGISDIVLGVVANMLKAPLDDLKPVDKETEEKVLDTGREVESKQVKMAVGTTVVRIFKALDKLFARIESSNGMKVTYST